MLPAFLAHGNGRRANGIADLLVDSPYDVIVFQEAFCPFARQRLQRQLGELFPYASGPANRKLFSLKTSSGLWILSRYPILSHYSITFKNKHGSDALSRKGALLVTLDIDGHRIQIAATHLQNSGGSWLRHAQCVEFYERLLKPNRLEGVPQVICGDFNINKNSAPESYRFMLTTLGAKDGDLNGEQQFTYDRASNDLHVEKGADRDLIDYILVRENGAWVDCANRQVRIIRKPWSWRHKDLSDHYPLAAEIYFSNAPAIVSVR